MARLQSRRLLVFLIVAVLASAGVAAWAYFNASATTGSSGRSLAGTVPAGNTPTTTLTGRNIGLSWTQNDFQASKIGQVTGGGYDVTRYAVNAPTTPISAGAICAGTITANGNNASCTENNVPTGRWQYTITPLFFNWLGAESAKSSPAITIAPATPTSISLVNGGGTGNAFINSANASSLSFDVVLPATSLATDTVTLTLTDPGTAHTVTATAAGTAGTGTVHFTAVNGTTLNQGTITIAAKSSSSYGDASGSTSTTTTKDTVAPTAPTSVSLSNGGGTGGVFINNANKASVNYNVVLPAGSLAADTVTFNLNDAGSAHTIGPLTKAGTAGAGTDTFNANNLATFNDGGITASATSTDQAGNTSGATSTTNTKDVVAPDAPTAVAISNGLGAGNAFINNTNKASVNDNVTTPAGANNSTNDTITVSLTSGLTVSGTKTPAPGSAGGTVTVSGIDATTLTEGSVAVSATATDQAGNASIAKAGTTTKDTIAPAAPTSVTLSNGGGTGGAFINSTNKASINYTVALASGSVAADTITFNLNDVGSAHTIGPLTQAGTVGVGTDTFNANSLTSFNDGVITASATATDQAGNTSTTTPTTNTKDTVAPTLDSVSLTGANLVSGTTYVNAANKASLGFSVAWTAGALNSSTDTLSVSLTGGATVTKTASRGTSSPTSGFGTVDANSLTDGALSLAATATDAAGNTSAPVPNSQTITKDVVAPDAPTAVAISNGLGAGNAFINNTNKASVDYLVTIPSGANNSTTDTVKVTLTSVASASGTKTPSNPGGTVTVTGINATSLTDGSVAVSAIATDLAGNPSGAKASTTTKDTIAPAAPTSVTLSNGGGTGGAFINSTNKASTNYTVALASGSVAADTITFNLNDVGSAHTIGPLTKAGTAGAGNATFSGNDVSLFNDGTITATATATDQAGNTSATTSTPNTKDTVAPNSPTAVSLSNGGGPGNAFINIANKGSLSYSVTNASNLSGDIITVTLSSTGGGSTVTGSATRGASSPTAVTGLNASGLGDGTVTASAKATDPAGNDSASAATTSNTKDTVAPTISNIQSFQSDGVTAGNGLMEGADKLKITFSEAVTNVAGSPTVTETRPTSANGDVTLDITGFTSNADTGSSTYLGTKNTTLSFSATTALTGSNSIVTITLGSTSSGGGTAAQSSGTLKFTQLGTITDLAGNPTVAEFDTASTFKLF